MERNNKMNKEHEEGKCPVCGSTNVTYGDFEFFEDNGAYYNMTCNNCKAEYREAYDLVFDQHYIKKRYNKK